MTYVTMKLVIADRYLRW